MHEIAELERRITAALERIGQGVAVLTTPVLAEMSVTTVEMAAGKDLAARQEALAEEQMANEQLNERLRMVHDQNAQALAKTATQVESLTRALDEQRLETQALHKMVVRLREEMRALREAAEAGVSDPEQINKAMFAELEALRAERSAETTEMADILSAIDTALDTALAPLIRAKEAHADA